MIQFASGTNSVGKYGIQKFLSRRGDKSPE